MISPKNWLARHPRRFFILLGALVLVAAGAIYADLQIGYYAAGNLGSIAQPAPPRLATDGAYKVAEYPRYDPGLAPGAGKQDTAAYCNTCHSPRYIPMQSPLPAATWAAEVKKMEKAYGAQIPSDAEANIIRYLQSHYTPQTRKR